MKNLALKLVKIAAELGGMKKDGRNQFQKFDYTSYEELYSHMRPLLEEHKIIIIPSVIAHTDSPYESNDGKNGWRTTVTMKFVIFDADNGETIEALATGAANDTADKSMGKAITECEKRWLFKLFKVSSKDDVDPDSEYPERKQPGSRTPTTPPMPPQKPAPAATPPAEAPDTGATGDPTANYRKHFQKVLGFARKSSANPDGIDMVKLAQSIMAKYKRTMTDLSISEMKTILGSLKDKGLIPGSTEV